MEHTLIPYAPGKLPQHAVVLVLAPHPDDEVFGCGGAIALHVLGGAHVHVVLVTAGDAAGQADERLAESAAAGQILGVASLRCWHVPDRGVAGDNSLATRIEAALAETGATLVHAPSLWENHPDHRALAEAVLSCLRRKAGVSWMAYEVSAPLRPNFLLDISAVLSKKQAAMACFASQLALQRYDRHLNALNVFRTYTLPPEVEAAEAYEYYPAPVLASGGLTLIEQECQRLAAVSPAADSGDDGRASARSVPLQAESARIASLLARLDQLAAERDAMLNSRSWRVTRPLRALWRLFGARSDCA